MIIRRASFDDIPWLLTQLREFAAFAGTKHCLFPADEAIATATVHSFIHAADTGNGVFLVAESLTAPREGVGFIVGVLGPHPFNPRLRTLAELFWWVQPSRRGSSAGARLLDAFIGFGKRNADVVTMVLEHGSPATLELGLAKRGFRAQERTYVLEVEREVAA